MSRLPSAGRLWGLATSFPGAHAFNAVLSMGFSLVQTLVFARALGTHDYALAVAAIAVGLYTLPLNQSVARANFVLLREGTVLQGGAGRLPEAGAAFHLSQLILLAVSLAAPAMIGAGDAREHLSLAALIFSMTFNNVWYSEIQMAMMATDRAMAFERLTLVRRLIIFALLALLLAGVDFLWFNLLTAAVTVAFHVAVVRPGAAAAGLFAWPRGMTAQRAADHVRRVGIAFQATLSEWLSLNGPYAVFSARFGVGGGLVALDAVLKLTRIVVSVTRNLCEIALPRVTREMLGGRPGRARVVVAAVMGASLAAAAMVALAVWLFERQVFDLLLGHNNTVPVGAGAPAAVAILASVVFAGGTHLLSYTGATSASLVSLAASVLAMGAFAAAVLLGGLAVTPALAAFAAAMTAVSAVAGVLLYRRLNPPTGG